MNETIDIESHRVESSPPQGAPPQSQTQAVVVRQAGGALAQPLTVEQIGERLTFIRRVMQEQMKEGQDYGKIPGTGDKPSLLQPGAQKLLLTFNLREQIKRETLREYPNFHREYEMVVTVFPAGQSPQDGWDGVGTCSTLESKYRYRKSERTCPVCHKKTIIKGKEEYGGGFVCFKKKGGCGAKFADDDQQITSQPAGDVENEDPADCWNTVRKMAFKRALVAASINATNTSELWTQDLEDMAGNSAAQADKGRAPKSPPKPPPPAPPPQRPMAHPTPPPQPAEQKAKPVPQPKFATEKTLEWMKKELEGAGLTDLAIEFMQTLDKPSVLLPNETLDNVPMWFVPISKAQLELLKAAITDFGNGDPAVHPYAPNALAPLPGKKAPAAKPAEKPPEPKPTPEPQAPAAPPKPKDPEAWRDIIVPIPPRGVRRDDYLKNPDTIGSLYDQCKSGNEPSCKRLWGFVNHFEPKPWVGHDGVQRPASETDKLFRQALDQFAEWHEANGHKNNPSEPQGEAARDALERDRQAEENQEEDRTPFD